MVKYKCNRCNKTFNRKSNYIYHINRKRPCKLVSQNNHKISHKNECSKCHKIYANKSNLNRHIKLYCNVNESICKTDENDLNNEEDIYIALDDTSNDSNNGGFDVQQNTPPHKTHKTHKNAQHKSKHICEYCEKMFTRHDTLIRHKKKYCKVKKENEEDMKKLLNKLIKQMEDQNIQMEDLKKTNKKLYKKVNKLEKGNTTHINSHNNTTNIQQNINLLSFGKDNTKSISNKDIKQILKRGFNSIQLMVKEINFNPNLPENHNVYIGNIKSRYAVTYNNGKWEIDMAEDVIDRIYDDKYGFLEQKYHELKNELTPYDRKKIERILDEYEGVKISKIFDKIKLVLYNDRHIPLKTKSIIKQ